MRLAAMLLSALAVLITPAASADGGPGPGLGAAPAPAPADTSATASDVVYQVQRSLVGILRTSARALDDYKRDVTVASAKVLAATEELEACGDKELAACSLAAARLDDARAEAIEKSLLAANEYRSSLKSLLAKTLENVSRLVTEPWYFQQLQAQLVRRAGAEQSDRLGRMCRTLEVQQQMLDTAEETITALQLREIDRQHEQLRRLERLQKQLDLGVGVPMASADRQ